MKSKNIEILPFHSKWQITNVGYNGYIKRKTYILVYRCTFLTQNKIKRYKWLRQTMYLICKDITFLQSWKMRSMWCWAYFIVITLFTIKSTTSVYFWNHKLSRSRHIYVVPSKGGLTSVATAHSIIVLYLIIVNLCTWPVCIREND